MECGCGRSPTGKCIGWHKLSEEEYQEKLKEYQDKEKDENWMQLDSSLWKNLIYWELFVYLSFSQVVLPLYP